MMKALSIQQPYAWLIANGYKDIENRAWSTRYRGFILIHTGKRIDTSLLSKNGYINHIYSYSPPWDRVMRSMPYREQDYDKGGIVGYATLVNIATNHTSPWFCGPYGFMVKDCHPLPLLPLRGQLGIFTVPPEIEAQVNALLREREEERRHTR